MSEIKTPAIAKASFDRRAVVKGAAWSVPVIAAAIAAPAAAASERSASLAFAATAPATFFRFGHPGNAGFNRTGTAAPSFTLQNTSGAITGDFTGTFTITPAAPTAGKLGVGITSLTATGTTYSGAFSTTSPTTYAGSFTHTGTVPSGGAVLFSLGGFHYNGNGQTPGGAYDVSLMITFSGGRQVTASSTINLV